MVRSLVPIMVSCVLVLIACSERGTWDGTIPPLPSKSATPIPDLGKHGIESVTFGITPYLERSLMEKRFAPVIEHLSKLVNAKVDFIIADDYDALDDMVVSGTVDIASFSPLAYVYAKEKLPDLVPLAMQMGDGLLSYSSYVLVKADSPYKSWKDLEGTHIAFVSKTSTSGFLLPYVAFIEKGVDPETFFGKISYTGDHITSLKKVATGEVDAAAAFYSAIGTARDTGVPTGSLRIILKPGRVPYDVVCARPGLDPVVQEAMKEALLSLTTKSTVGMMVLKSELKINGWVEADDSRYDGLRATLATYRAWMAKKEGTAAPPDGGGS